MKITIEICCDESFGEARWEKAEKALEVLAKVVGEAQEHSGMLIDPSGERSFAVYGPKGEPCGVVRCEG